MAEQTIKLASFWYVGQDGVERTALRGETIDLVDERDRRRGERLDAFATDADFEPGTVFGDFYLARQANRVDAGLLDLGLAPVVPVAPVPSTPAPVIDPPIKPGGAESRDKWAAYAKAMGAPESATAPVELGGMTRDELRAEYGS